MLYTHLQYFGDESRGKTEMSSNKDRGLTRCVACRRRQVCKTRPQPAGAARWVVGEVVDGCLADPELDKCAQTAADKQTLD